MFELNLGSLTKYYQKGINMVITGLSNSAPGTEVASSEPYGLLRGRVIICPTFLCNEGQGKEEWMLKASIWFTKISSN